MKKKNNKNIFLLSMALCMITSSLKCMQSHHEALLNSCVNHAIDINDPIARRNYDEEFSAQLSNHYCGRKLADYSYARCITCGIQPICPWCVSTCHKTFGHHITECNMSELKNQLINQIKRRLTLNTQKLNEYIDIVGYIFPETDKTYSKLSFKINLLKKQLELAESPETSNEIINKTAFNILRCRCRDSDKIVCISNDPEYRHYPEEERQRAITQINDFEDSFLVSRKRRSVTPNTSRKRTGRELRRKIEYSELQDYTIYKVPAIEQTGLTSGSHAFVNSKILATNMDIGRLLHNNLNSTLTREEINLNKRHLSQMRTEIADNIQNMALDWITRHKIINDSGKNDLMTYDEMIKLNGNRITSIINGINRSVIIIDTRFNRPETEIDLLEQISNRFKTSGKREIIIINNGINHWITVRIERIKGKLRILLVDSMNRDIEHHKDLIEKLVHFFK